MTEPNVPVATGTPYRYRGIPEPFEDDIESLYATVAALQEVVEVLIGMRPGENRGQAVTHGDVPNHGSNDAAPLQGYVRWEDILPMMDHMRWRYVWEPGFYEEDDVVYDEGWLMCANKDTNGRAAPQPTGSPETDTPDVPTWTYSAHTGVVWSGHQYTLLKGGWFTQLKVWAPTLSASTNYRILIIDATNVDAPEVTVIEEPVLLEDAWTTIALGATPYSTGAVLLVILDALNSGSESQVIGGWTRGTNQNTTEPAAQTWNRRNQDDVVRIDFTDLDSVGRQTELEGIIPGSTIQFVSTVNPNASATYHVDVTTTGVSSVIYDVTRSDTGIAGDPPVGAATTMTATIPVAQMTDYVQLPAYWPTNDPSFATMRGTLRLSGVDQSVPTEAFGIQVTFQEASVSPDWDLMAYTRISGSDTEVAQSDIDEILDILGGM